MTIEATADPEHLIEFIISSMFAGKTDVPGLKIAKN